LQPPLVETLSGHRTRANNVFFWNYLVTQDVERSRDVAFAFDEKRTLDWIHQLGLVGLEDRSTHPANSFVPN
jgi:hypothetical protein